MDIQVFLYDSFTQETFGGSPAGVVLNAGDLDLEIMQKIALELNAPTTGFVVGYEAGVPPVYSVRYFTPHQEIDLCGHVTIALFTALGTHGNHRFSGEEARLRLKTPSGELSVLLHSGNDGNPLVEMDQKLPYFETLSQIEWGAVQEVLGNVPLHPILPVEIASTGLRHLIVPYRSLEDISRLVPDFEAVIRLSRKLKVDTVCAFAPVENRPAYFRLRDFCAGIGDYEEPASGTTSGALTCYLFRHRLVAPDKAGDVRVVVEQGVEMGRPSKIEARLTVKDGNITRVSVKGQAILVLEGTIRLP